MGPKVIKWDGSHVPEELRSLPPGRYAIESVDQVGTLSEEEEAGILAGLADLDAGKGIPLSDVVREIIRGSTTR
jgi:predicted transcriptional regulator